jgi:metal-sulfur cluster biosynthetic enzyme
MAVVFTPADHPWEPAIRAALATVYDPEIPVDILNLGLIYEVSIDETGLVSVVMSLTSPACPVAGELPLWVADAVATVPGASVVPPTVTFDPPWGLERMSDRNY